MRLQDPAHANLAAFLSVSNENSPIRKQNLLRLERIQNQVNYCIFKKTKNDLCISQL